VRERERERELEGEQQEAEAPRAKRVFVFLDLIRAAACGACYGLGVASVDGGQLVVSE